MTLTLAELHREAAEFADLLEAADPFLEVWGQAARRLAEVDDPAQFHADAVQLAWDIDNLRGTPAGYRCEALFRWTRNPVGVGHALASRARAVALDRCEVDQRDRPCDGPRVLSLAVWTCDGLAETWPELCAAHLLDYAATWDPGYAELVIGGQREPADRAFWTLHSQLQGSMNIRMGSVHG